jgi:4-carboxymuconolactone decarboxylase
MTKNPPPAEPGLKISRTGSRPLNAAPAQNFTGQVGVEMLYTPVDAEHASAATVCFAPGARTAWHSHPLGQTLVVTAGVGRVQGWGGPVELIRAGDVVHIPAHLRHWHGAAPDSAMTHLAITEVLEGTSADWMEQVSDAQYGVAPAPVAVTSPSR